MMEGRGRGGKGEEWERWKDVSTSLTNYRPSSCHFGDTTAFGGRYPAHHAYPPGQQANHISRKRTRLPSLSETCIAYICSRGESPCRSAFWLLRLYPLPAFSTRSLAANHLAAAAPGRESRKGREGLEVGKFHLDE